MLVIGLDVGTTGTKAIVCDEKGKILGSGYKEYELICDRAGFVFPKGCGLVGCRNICGTACDGKHRPFADRGDIPLTQGASMLAADKYGNALSEVITWMDNSAVAECEELTAPP